MSEEIDINSHSDIASEPAVDCAVSVFPYLDERIVFGYPADYDPQVGPYTMEEVNARIAKTEHDRNNPDKWVRVDDFWAEMKKRHLWL